MIAKLADVEGQKLSYTSKILQSRAQNQWFSLPVALEVHFPGATPAANGQPTHPNRFGQCLPYQAPLLEVTTMEQ